MDDETDDETDDENLCAKAQDSLETVYPSFQLSFKKLGLFRVSPDSSLEEQFEMHKKLFCLFPNIIEV